MGVQVQVLSCGDAFGSGGRYNTCFLVLLLMDCGASSLIAMKRYGVDPDAIDIVFLSHLHGDHFGGLVFLLREATLLRRRIRGLTIAGPVDLERRLRAALEAFFPGGWGTLRDFPVRFVELRPGEETDVDGVRVTPALVEHDCGAPPLALRITVDKRIIAYSGDTAWVDGLLDVGRGADLFICVAYKWDQEATHHLGLSTVRAKLQYIQPRRLLLTHLGADLIQRPAQIDLPVAEDGMIIEL